MSAWIFQGNPAFYDIDTYLRNNNPVWWRIAPRHYQRSIEPGDRVFLWRADGERKGTGGVVAVGQVVAPPQVLNERSIPGFELWLTPPTEPATPKAQIRLDDIRLTEDEGMLLRTDLKRDPVLSALTILKYPASTTYLVKPDLEMALLARWQDAGGRR